MVTTNVFRAGKAPLLYSLIERTARKNPDKYFVRTENGGISYEGIRLLTCKTAKYLKETFGLGANSTILLCAPNSVESIAVIIACHALGIRLISLPSTLGAMTLESVLRDFNPVLAICDDSSFKSLSENAPTLLKYIRLSEVMTQSYRMPVDMECLHVENGLDGVVLYSSGSTGSPKAIINTVSAFAANMKHFGDGIGLGPDDVIYAPIPFDHCFGLGGLFCAIIFGTTFVTCEKYTAEKSLLMIDAYKPTVYLCVPTMISREAAILSHSTHDLSSLRICAVGGAPCTSEAMERYERASGCALVQTYGMTETAGGITVCSADDPFEVRKKCAGKPIEGAEIVIDSTNGEILCKSPSLAKGWISSGAFHSIPLNENGYYRSGDLGRFDSDGRLIVVGRLKNIIIRGGVNILPSEIEEYYSTIDGVTECCVVGYPDEELGERTCLCFTASDGFKIPLASMRLLANGKLEKCKFPDYALRFQSFPRLSNGKTDVKTLKSLVAKCVRRNVHYVSSEELDAFK